MEEVLFISNKLFLDTSLPEGGVRLCTFSYINLLKTKYHVHFLSVDFNRSIFFRLRARLGVDAYEEYNCERYHNELHNYIVEKGIKKIFVNLSNLSEFGKYIKEKFADRDVKVILCSHGNESGDFLHQATRFTNDMSFIPRFFSSYRLGQILKKETEYRLNYFDFILTVSPVEEQIEKWLGAKHVYMVPRVFDKDFINWTPMPGRIGFIGDITHLPNFHGVKKLCEALSKRTDIPQLELRLVGKPNKYTEDLTKSYPFLTVLGYLDNQIFKAEAATWNYYLNLVFYYSKGVSTKLEKGINWGLPVISTTPGNRGYIFRNGTITTVDNPEEMATVIADKLKNPEQILHDRNEVVKIVDNTIGYNDIMTELDVKFVKAF